MRHTLTKKQLKNGTDVLFINTPDAASAYVGIYIKGGNRACAAEKHQLAHILEHAVYSGSEGFPSVDELLEKLESNGALTNAETNNYYNKYEFITTLEELNSLLPVAVDMIYRPLLTKKSLELEKEIVRNEISERISEIQAHILSIDTTTILPDLEPTLEEQLATVDNISLSDVKSFHKKYYSLKNSAIIIAGSLPSPEQANLIDMLEQNVANVVAGDRHESQKKEIAKGFCDIIPIDIPDKDSSLVHMSFNKDGKPTDEAFAQLKVFEALITGGLSGLISRKLRDTGYLYSLEADCGGSIELTEFSFAAQIPRAKTGRFMYAFLRELQSVLGGGFTDKSLNRAKQMIKSGLARSHESPEGLVDWYEMEFVLSLPLKSSEDRIKEVEAVKRRDIEGLKSFFTYDNSLTIYAANTPSEIHGSVVLGITTAYEDSEASDKTTKNIERRGESILSDYELTAKYESRRGHAFFSWYAILFSIIGIFVIVDQLRNPVGGTWARWDAWISIPTLAAMAYFFYEPKIPLKIPFARLFWSTYALALISVDTYYNVFILNVDWDSIGGLVLVLPAYIMILWLGIKGPFFPKKYWEARSRVYPLLEKATAKIERPWTEDDIRED